MLDQLSLCFLCFSFVFFHLFDHPVDVSLALLSRLYSDPLLHPDLTFVQIEDIRNPDPPLLPLAGRLLLDGLLAFDDLDQPAIFISNLLRGFGIRPALLVAGCNTLMIVGDLRLFCPCKLV